MQQIRIGDADAKLIELCRKCLAAIGRVEGVFERYPTKDLAYETASKIEMRCTREATKVYAKEVVPLMRRIAKIVPVTLDGFAAKACVVVRDHATDFIGERSPTDCATSWLLKELADRAHVLRTENNVRPRANTAEAA